MFKELWYLIKLLFSPLTDQIELVEMKYFPFKGYSAMSWCGKIITRKPLVSQRVFNHERLHLEQALKLVENDKQKTWLKYYWQYLKYWIKGNPIMAPASSAYYTIPFEMEAYGNEDDYNYHPISNSWKLYELEDRKETYKKHRDNWKQFCKDLV